MHLCVVCLSPPFFSGGGAGSIDHALRPQPRARLVARARVHGIVQYGVLHESGHHHPHDLFQRHRHECERVLRGRQHRLLLASDRCDVVRKQPFSTTYLGVVPYSVISVPSVCFLFPGDAIATPPSPHRPQLYVDRPYLAIGLGYLPCRARASAPQMHCHALYVHPRSLACALTIFAAMLIAAGSYSRTAFPTALVTFTNTRPCKLTRTS